MADEKEKKKKAPAKAPAEKAVKAKKEAAPKAESAPKAKKQSVGKMLKVTQIGSPIGRQDYQKATLIGLGLNKLHRSRELEDTPSVRGMIEKVRHLVKIEEAA